MREKLIELEKRALKELESVRDIEGLEKEKKLSKEFFEELWVLVERIHRRGVAHCDLKRAPNILLGDDGKPYLVDWSAAIFRTESRFFPFHLLYRRFLLDDFNAITKIQLRHCPESITSEEKKRYDPPYRYSETEPMLPPESAGYGE